MSKDNCTTEKSHSLVKIEENKRVAIFRNPRKLPIRVSRVDGCLVTKGIRSDFVVSEPDAASIIVELKGVDVAHACDQLFATVEHPEVKPLLEAQIGFLVICSRYPRFDSFVAKAKQKAAKRYKAGFHVVKDKGQFDIARVAAIDGPN
ncbi:hypothetical protein [Brevundimonas nasdae]|uniref:Uncharacterized protein n=1 Tax=Brevundimonas nasdae TaxID=172043 RepID=A0ACD4VNG8_9CAUL|nr:hypothetical protein [Brevundimonas nasdae]WOB79623.1 hypothetical protein PZA08_05500 [Brevundimonas nasdae]